MRSFSDDPEFANLIHNIITLRQRHGLSKRAMAGIMHISPRTLDKLENGQMPPLLKVEALCCLSSHFHISVPDLLRLRV